MNIQAEHDCTLNLEMETCDGAHASRDGEAGNYLPFFFLDEPPPLPPLAAAAAAAPSAGSGPATGRSVSGYPGNGIPGMEPGTLGLPSWRLLSLGMSEPIC